MRRAVRTVALAIAAPAAVLFLLMAVGGHDAGAALRALWEGSFGSWYAFTSATLVRAIPLILAGLGVAVAFRAGVWNIGAEGQLLAGAAAAAVVALGSEGTLGSAALPLALAAGIVGGALWAGIAALLRERYGVLEVISTIMLNFIALYLVGYLVRGPLQEGTHIYPQSAPLAAAAQLPRMGAGSRLHWGLVAAVAAAPALWWWMSRTAAGFRLRAVGANADAAAMAGGIDVPRVRRDAFLLSGAFAGLAGAIQLTGVTFALYEDLSPGYGFTAIAVALLARLEPLAVVPAGVLFAALESGSLAMQRDAGIPSVTVSIVEGALILFALATWSRRPFSAMPVGRRAAEPA
ncbi:MAG TPA: ABC transporter permease [Gemmatimonadaceae bacterium]|nr:ABC transporter permease [Gemmatimonadaceae bacterium]